MRSLRLVGTMFTMSLLSVLLLGCGTTGSRAGVMPTGTWGGRCVGSTADDGWGTLDVSLQLSPGAEGELAAEGALSFVGRETRAQLRGALAGAVYRLQGKMREVGGFGTVWDLGLEVDPVERQAPVLRGRLFELLDAGEKEPMCSFTWSAPQ